MTTYYRCEGPVRGWCGIEHRSLRASGKCCARDHRGCRAQGGYSDRGPVAYETGTKRHLAPAEMSEWQEGYHG